MKHPSFIFLFFFFICNIRKERHGAADDADRFETVSRFGTSVAEIIHICSLSRAGRSHDDRQKDPPAAPCTNT